MNYFALIGAAGFVAPRHMTAISETGNVLSAAYDPHDSIGIIDSYFPKANFFTEFERFDRYVYKSCQSANPINYISICSPNYLHDAHIRFGMRSGADVICEKPLVLNPWNIDGIEEMENTSGKRTFTILQLRLHPTIVNLRNKLLSANNNRIHDVDLVYLTSRGNWYYTSWKGDISKSGGIATNIGIHFFDMLGWLFGELQTNIVHIQTHDRAAGFLQFKHARVRWFLSINPNCLPIKATTVGKRTWRRILIDGEELEFSEGFTDLHTISYENILSGRGFRASESRNAIEIVHSIRHTKPIGLVGDYHPMAKLPLEKHPFL